jgi:predicted metalloprotease with PDZ domain
MRRLLLALAAFLLIGAGPASEPVRYRVTPVMADGALAALAVEVRLRGDADGQTVLELPGNGADGTERWRLLSDLTVEGAETRSDGDDKRVLTHAPGAAIVVRYRVRSAYSPEPPADNPPLKGPMLRPAWFMAPGFIFATPQGRDGAPATFEWGRLPKGWKAASNLEPAAGQTMTVQNVFDGILIGGRDLTLLSRPIAGARLSVAVLPADWSVPPARIADALARVMVGQRAFWGDLKTPFFVGVTPMEPTSGRGSVGGFGRWQGFALFAATNSQLQIFEGNIAHEHTHAWIPTRVGRAPNGRAQVGQYWLSEGFTDFFGDRAILRSGVWSTETYVAALNRALERYGTSPARNAPNSEILEKAFRDPAFTQLPYDRGRLLAFVWDRRIAQATGGRKRLDDVAFTMRDRFLAAPAGARPTTVENLVRSYRDLSGLDLGDDIVRYAERGETVTLPEDLFAPCARVVAVTREVGGLARTFQRVELGPDGGSPACAALIAGTPRPDRPR